MSQHEHPFPGQRLAKLDHFDDYQEAGVPERSWVDSLNEANLISSEVIDSGGRHKPVLDLDFPAKLIESSTAEHRKATFVRLPWVRK